MKKTKIIVSALLSLLLVSCRPNTSESSSDELLSFVPEVTGMFVGFDFSDESKNKPEYSDFMHPDAFRYIEGAAGVNGEAYPKTYAKDHFMLSTHYEVSVVEEGVTLKRTTRTLELTLTDYFFNATIMIHAVALDENSYFTLSHVNNLITELDVTFNVKLEEKLINQRDQTGEVYIWNLTINFSQATSSVTFKEMSAEDIKIKEYTLFDPSLASITKDPLTSYIIANEVYVVDDGEVNEWHVVQDNQYFYKFGPDGYLPTASILNFT